jgi:hypothetical protein
MSRGRFENVTQGRDERVDAATEILQIDKHHIECAHHRIGRPAHFSIKTEDWNAMHRIDEVGGLDHVVLLVAAQTMLRTEGSGEFDVVACRQSIQGVPQIFGDGSGMREQRHALALEWCSQRRLG